MPAFAAHPQTAGWALSGLTYVGYNIIGAVVILPVLRHLTSDRDAIIVGRARRPADDDSGAAVLHSDGRLLSRRQSATLPSDYLLQRMGMPAFHLLFQVMIFSALLESGTSAVHAINERVDHAWQAHARQARCRTARG